MMSSSYQISQPRSLSIFIAKKSDEISSVFVPKRSTIHYQMAVRKEIKAHLISKNSKRTALPIENESITRYCNSKSINNANINVPSVYDITQTLKPIPVFIPRKAPDFKSTEHRLYHYRENNVCELFKEATAKRHKRQ